MDVGDFDQDGKKDIILGNFIKPGLGQQTDDKKPIPVVWLRNIAD